MVVEVAAVAVDTVVVVAEVGPLLIPHCAAPEKSL